MVSTIGILGAGRVGSAIARTALTAGYAVHIAGSGPAADIQLIVDIVTPGAVAMTTADVVSSADLVILAVPLHKYRSVQPGPLAGKIVIDTMNYWQPIDGDLAEFSADARSSSEVVGEYFAGARLVKTLNHIGYHELEEDGREPGAADRRGLALAGDDEAAKALVARFIDRLGYDPVDAGPLAAGRAFQPGTAIFSARHSAEQLRGILAETRRAAAA